MLALLLLQTVAAVTVKGMTSAETCGQAVTRKLENAAGVSSVKLLDFPRGLFQLTFKAEIDPAELRKAVEPRYEIARIETTMAGTLSLDEAKLYLVSPSGARYHLNGSCAEKPDPAAKACADVEARLRAWLAAKKTSVRVTGELAESCCEGEQLLSTLKAEAVER